MNTLKFFTIFVFVALASAQLPTLPDGFADILTIDDFEIQTNALVIVTGGSVSTLSGFTQDTNILGGERDLVLTVTGGASNLVLSAGVANGLYSVAAPNGASGVSSLSYDGVDGASAINVGGISQNFRINGATSIRTVANADLATTINFIVYEGGATCTFSLSIPAGDDPEGYEMPYSGFSGGCAFTDVGALEIEAPIDDNVDVELRLISLFGPIPSETPTPSPVPTPSTTPSASQSPVPTPSPSGCRDDPDSDGVGDPCDNCPTTFNTDQANSDSDSLGDACDNCQFISNIDQTNSDSDSFGDVCDNCMTVNNEDQANADNDNFGDVCDNCPNNVNNDQTDSDNDGLGDACDNCPNDPNADQTDSDNDGLGDACDPSPSPTPTGTGTPSPTGTGTPSNTPSPSVSPSNTPTPSDTCICKCPIFTCEIFRVDDGDYLYYRGFFETFRNAPEFFNTLLGL